MNPLSQNSLLKSLWSVIMILTICAAAGSCNKAPGQRSSPISRINTTHLDALYAEMKVGTDTVGIIHLYSEYPDYHLVGDADEGIACLDDASRAAIFYLRQYAVSENPEHLRKGRMLLKFLLAMQAPNGYYYNFIWPDGRIHTDGPTTKPEPNFWSWRTLWAFGEAIQVLEKNDPLIGLIKTQREKLVENLLADQDFKSFATDTAMGWTFPAWLPKVCGTDQAAIVLIGLSWRLQQPMDDSRIERDSIVSLMRHLADGILMMQIREKGNKQDGAFLSWENLWHAYANIQSYGLLTAGQTLKDTTLINNALYEVKHFYPSLLANGRLDHFSVRISEEKIVTYDEQSFPQIAYGVRPMVWASLEAFLVTGDTHYLEQAKALGSWFSGNNPAKAMMYDPATGRGFDGIISPDQINRNAGAESTIEALLTLQALERFE